jgi:hypothetical protein
VTLLWWRPLGSVRLLAIIHSFRIQQADSGATPKDKVQVA